MDFSVEILVSEHNLKQVLDSERPGTVRVLPRRDFGQEMCKKPPTRYTSLDGGLDPVALEPTDEPTHRQYTSNLVWNGLRNGTGVAGRYDRLPNQCAPLFVENPELSDRKI